MTDIKTVLKPCPFCAGNPKHIRNSLDERYGYAVSVTYECQSCGVAKSAIGDTTKPGYADNSTVEQRAMAAWNTRTAPVDAQDAVDAKLLQQARDALHGMLNKRGYGCGDGSDHQVEQHNTAANNKATEAIAAIDAALQASQTSENQDAVKE
ncbi:Lar family restriction alleviation protein [Herminiimonas contaminans]|uniref:Lar family restriction alleviation protein n=1 Tax=Herminiimonas contaminans TaxID=1111140 RepID=A0ABS0ESZ7_9BURK|nr:Lar family restriction alleviation protein [Herminiimonas contaminans]MBF8177845.1 Lar family restriction alleviation protein [Herminiimonas contaminans]